MRTLVTAVSVFILFLSSANGRCDDIPLSPATEECLDCHATIHPGIVGGWQDSRHAKTAPKQAAKASELSRKVSGGPFPDDLASVAVGCAECHTLRPGAHADTVEHNGYRIHLVVSPEDCATCHARESEQYKKNIMAFAEKNLAENRLYQDLQRHAVGLAKRQGDTIHFEPAGETVREQACFYCHGTRLKVLGFETRDSDFGEMTFARVAGWPNQGVGRVNLDGSRGACTACHTRHTFSMEMARKPDTCMECHVGPDVPAYKVYAASKHGNIFSSLNRTWNFAAVPWTPGKDFTAPTCAACHMSLLTDTEETVIVERTHQINNRLGTRIFGLIYAHPQPKSPDTTIIRNKSGLSLPTDLDGTAATGFLIDRPTQAARNQTMQAVCLSCHSVKWVKGHWRRHEETILETNAATLTATKILQDIWKDGLAQGPDAGGSIADEAIEKKWMDIWLFHANTTRFAAAMAGGGDYGVYANGRYHINKKIRELNDWYRLWKKIETR